MALIRLQDVLVIDANVRAPDSPHDGGLDFLTKLSRTPSIFDSQLYLYETIGVLTSMLGQDVSQQTAILHSILTPLVEGMRAHVRTEMRSVDDLKAILMVHHFILAIGSVAKGFPDLSTRDAKPSGKWAEEFKVATDAILSVTKTLAGLQVVRDAVRSSSSPRAGMSSFRPRPAPRSTRSSRPSGPTRSPMSRS